MNLGSLRNVSPRLAYEDLELKITAYTCMYIYVHAISYTLYHSESPGYTDGAFQVFVIMCSRNW